VIETNYHIFIIAHTAQGDVLLETTDAINGFVTGEDRIGKRISFYKQNKVQAAGDDQTLYRYSYDLYNAVNQDELVGLLFYNLSVDSFNQKDIKQSVAYLAQAGARYLSPRLEEFSFILLVTIRESALSDMEKTKLTRVLQTIRHKASPALANLE
jgi:hypothetical protein